MKRKHSIIQAKRLLGQRIAAARQNAGLTQVQLSEKVASRFKTEDIRLSVRSIEEIEAGRANPSFEKLYVIAICTNTTLESLLNDLN